MGTQNRLILSHLKRGRGLTSLQAIDMFGCMRLASRIDELRNQGHQIHTEMVKRGNKRYAKYWLMQAKRAA